ncbi:MAG: hypothetical protein AAGI01_16930, partial [Myxococcota bacterium]
DAFAWAANHGMGVLLKHRWTFAHETLREALLARATMQGRLQRDHDTCARMLVLFYGESHLGSMERRGMHLLGARRVREALGPILRTAEGYRRRGDFLQARTLLELWDEHARRLALSDVGIQGVQGACAWGALYLAQGDLLSAREHSLRARRASTPLEDPRCDAEVDLLEGELARRDGQLTHASAAFERALTHAQHAGDVLLRARCLIASGELEVALGRQGIARRRLMDALEVLERSRHSEDWARALLALSELVHARGEERDGRRLVDEAMQRFQAQGDRIAMAYTYNALGERARRSGELEQATQHYQRALELFREMGSKQVVVPYLNLAFTALERGDFARTSFLVDAVAQELEEGARHGYLGCALLARACCDAASADWGSWDAHLEQAIWCIESTGLLERDAAQLATRAGELARAQSAPERAATAFSLALSQWSRLRDEHQIDYVRAQLEELVAPTA